MDELYNYILSTGVIIPDTSILLGDVTGEYQQTFGMDLVTTPDTPQGLLIISETAARSAVAENNAALANQINPNYSGGVFLDALLDLTGSERIASTPSTVTATLTGVSGTVIAQGAQASDSVYNNVFATTTDVTIVDGTATVVMNSVENVSLLSFLEMQTLAFHVLCVEPHANIKTMCLFLKLNVPL